MAMCLLPTKSPEWTASPSPRHSTNVSSWHPSWHHTRGFLFHNLVDMQCGHNATFDLMFLWCLLGAPTSRIPVIAVFFTRSSRWGSGTLVERGFMWCHHRSGTTARLGCLSSFCCTSSWFHSKHKPCLCKRLLSLLLRLWETSKRLVVKIMFSIRGCGWRWRGCRKGKLGSRVAFVQQTLVCTRPSHA